MSIALPPSGLPLTPRIAVIGGGITGLAAAHRILELLPAAKLSLFEATKRLGGVLETVERDGFLIEHSADNFLAVPAVRDLCDRLELMDELLPTDAARRRAFVVRSGKLIPIPQGFYLMSPRRAWPILASPLLSVSGKLRLLAEPLVPPRPVAVTDESIASFARRRLGREVFKRLVQPLVAGIYTADPEKLSMAATMPQFLDYERTHGSLLRATLRSNRSNPDTADEAAVASGARYGLLVAPRLGMNQLVSALVSRLPADCIHVEAAVKGIRRCNDGWLLDVGTQGNEAFDAVVLALPAYAAGDLIMNLDPALGSELQGIEYAGCAIVSLAYRRDQIGHALNGFGFIVPQTEGRQIIAASFASLKFAGRAPADDVLIRVFVGGALQPDLLDRSDAELKQIASTELAELLQTSGEPLFADVARWPRSMPQYHVGHLDRVARIEQLASRHATLALAGNAYRGVGIPQCIASGNAAAEMIASALRD